MSPSVSRVALISATARQAREGLLGWVSFDLDETLRVDGVALRRRIDGRLTLAFPHRQDRSGGVHPYLRPLDAVARSLIERQVFLALGLDPGGEGFAASAPGESREVPLAGRPDPHASGQARHGPQEAPR
jgi:hypothetical protein